MTAEDIKNLSELLEPYLGPDRKITNSKITNMTAPGENFGSIMLAVELTVKNSDGKEEDVHAVAKLLPPTPIIREIFNIQVTFKNELRFYDTIVPTLQEFQREQGVSKVIDCFGEFYGGRMNLDSSNTKVDDEAVLIIENLKVAGFSNIDRYQGFDLDGAKVVLKDLAQFHAVPIALKLAHPDVFEAKIKPYLTNFDPPFFGPIKEVLVDLFNEDEFCRLLLPKLRIWSERPLSTTREPFATVAHCDLWVNNTMQKIQNGKIINNKLVDFQVIAYRSPAADLFFFLWTSLPKNILEKHLTDLIRYYHDCFIDNLKQLKCDTLPFTFEKFAKELKIESEYEFGHALQFLVLVIHGKKGTQPEDGAMDKEYFKKILTQQAKENIWYMAKECYKRGWLY